jgi:hypothetical protein
MRNPWRTARDPSGLFLSRRVPEAPPLVLFGRGSRFWRMTRPALPREASLRVRDKSFLRFRRQAEGR